MSAPGSAKNETKVGWGWIVGADIVDVANLKRGHQRRGLLTHGGGFMALLPVLLLL